MASQKIKGITVEIGGDVGPLEKALKNAKSGATEVEKELRSIEKALKLDPGNIDLLTQKQSKLKIALTENKKAASDMRLMQGQLNEQYKAGRITAEQYTEANARMQRELSAVTTRISDQERALQSCNPAMEAATVQLKAFGDKATALGQKLAPLSGAAALVGGGMVGLAVKAGAAADDINTLAKQTGMSTAEIQKLKYAADLIDVPLETVTGSLGKLTKNMATAQKGTGDAAKAFSTLGISITEPNGELRNAHVIFAETIRALGSVSNETQRDAMAMQLFGKSARDLNPLILGGADALFQLGNEAQAAGLILSQDALDAANAFNDEIDKLKAQSAGTFQALGVEIGQALLPMLKELAKGAKEVLEWVKSLDKDTLAMIMTIVAVVAAAAPLIMLIGGIAQGLSALSAAMTALAANPVVLLVAAIAVIVAALILLLATNDDFQKKFMAVWNAIADFIKKIGDWIADIFIKKIPEAFDKMGSAVKKTMDGLVKIIKAPINGIIEIINLFIDGINALLDAISFDIKMPDWLGGQRFYFGGWEIPKVPLLKDGGVLSSGSAIFAENGPEYLSVMNGKAYVTPLTQGARTTALAPMQSNAPAAPTIINVNVDHLEDYENLMRVTNGARLSQRQGYVHT